MFYCKTCPQAAARLEPRRALAETLHPPWQRPRAHAKECETALAQSTSKILRDLLIRERNHHPSACSMAGPRLIANAWPGSRTAPAPRSSS